MTGKAQPYCDADYGEEAYKKDVILAAPCSSYNRSEQDDCFLSKSGPDDFVVCDGGAAEWPALISSMLD